MSNFRPINRDTGFLLPPSVDEWLPQRHLARFVVEVIEGLDLSELIKAYRGSGSASYHPAMLLGLLVYGYATKTFSSRGIERATHDSVAFRFIAGNEHPDHDTIAAFRKRFLPQLRPLFLEVLQLARTMGMLKLGTVALDGTKVHANASRHSALSYGHAKKIEKQLKREVEQLLRLAERADARDIPDGMSIPEELERRESRLAAIAAAKATIEGRAEERLEREQCEHQSKLAARAEQEKQTGKKPRGRPPAPPTGGVQDKEQVNLTDEQSRIMKVAGGGFDQCYNASWRRNKSLCGVFARSFGRIPKPRILQAQVPLSCNIGHRKALLIPYETMIFMIFLGPTNLGAVATGEKRPGADSSTGLTLMNCVACDITDPYANPIAWGSYVAGLGGSNENSTYLQYTADIQRPQRSEAPRPQSRQAGRWPVSVTVT